MEKTVNSLKLELRTNQVSSHCTNWKFLFIIVPFKDLYFFPKGGTRVWRIRAFAALCVITILPLAVLTIVTLVKVYYSHVFFPSCEYLKEEALEESEEQLENDMNQKFEKLEEKMIPKVVCLTS